ncbi:MAG: hypothetical protein JRH07_15000 [Deltaproteobacteria bacterium]|nr:hypothetical protein [Deltaproteobacteria bacterium]MBW2123131.1 hypothetical protein [Deltaproteobacteria bacterium]
MKGTVALLAGLAVLGVASQGLTGGSSTHQIVLCTDIENAHPPAWVLEKLGNEFFDQESIRSVTTRPQAVGSVFVKGRDKRVFLVSRWHGLEPDRSYTFSARWIDPQGEIWTAGSASFHTPGSLDPGVFFTFTAHLDMDDSLRSGRWNVEVFLNGELVERKSFVIASSD